MSLLRSIICGMVLLLAAACGVKNSEMPQTPVSITLRAPKQGPSPCAGVTQAVLTVSAADISPPIVIGPLPAASGQAVEFKAMIPDGSKRLFTVTASNDQKIVLCQASQEADLTAGIPLALEMEMTIAKISTETSLTSNANLSLFGQSVTFTAIVTAAVKGIATPTGTVAFQDNGVAISGCVAQPVISVDGFPSATCALPATSTPILSVGAHSITATYSGDERFTTSTSPSLIHTVNEVTITQVLVNGIGPMYNSQIVISGSTALVVWESYTSGNYDILLARSTDGGATFSVPVNLSNNAGYVSSFSPKIVVSGATALVIWQDSTNHLLLARSTDGGATFSAPVTLSNNAGSSFSPKIVISCATALVVWDAGGNILLARSMDGGATFSAPVNVSNNAGASSSPEIVISSATALVVWRSGSTYFLARSTDGGATFSAPVNLSNNTVSLFSPQIVIAGLTALAVWEYNNFGTDAIFLARSTDGGATFSAPVNLSNNAGSSFSPKIVIAGLTVLVIWQNDTSGDIFLARSTDGGSTFSVPVNISNNAGYSRSAQIVISGSTALVVWQDNTSGTNDIFLARSIDGGATFSAPVVLIKSSGYFYSPRIAISGSTALVVLNNDD